MTITIASAAELTRALSKAQGGETFLLAPGNYGSLRFDELEFDRAVTIRSADPLNMAKLTGLHISESENIRIVGLDVGRPMTPKEVGFGKIVAVFDSENISFESMNVHGSLDGNPQNDGYGIYVTNSESVSIRRSNFSELARGVVVDRSSELVLDGNRFDTIRTDGANFRQVTDVIVKDNHFSNFFPNARDHSDAIQFSSHGARHASSNITITGNQMFTGRGAGPQGIFLNDETGRLPYKNVTIDNNILYGADSYHGIAVLGGQAVTITNNTVVSSQEDGKNFWITVERVTGATIRRNVTDIILSGKNVSGLNQDDNLTLFRNDDPRERQLNLERGSETTISDLVLSGIGYVPGASSPAPTPSPSPSPAPPPTPQPPTGPASIINIFGTSGHDQLRGTDASERIYGFSMSDRRLGAGSRDVMLGSGGRDVFVLGDQRGVFYDDGAKGSGRRDYASIRDFEAGDTIQLAGDASDYVLRSETFGRKGMGIYLDTNGSGRWDSSDEFIAHVSGSRIPTSLGTGDFVFTATSNRASFDVSSAFTEEDYAPEEAADEEFSEVLVDSDNDALDFEATDLSPPEVPAVFEDDVFTIQAAADYRLFDDLAASRADYFTFG